MEIKGMKEEFFEWLNECPVQWFLETDEKERINYAFVKEEEEPEEDEE